MANMSAQILRNIVASVFEVKPQHIILSGVLPEDFYMEEKNSSGNLFRCNSNFSFLGFDPKKGFVELPPNAEGRSQNADKSWNQEKAWSIRDFSRSEVEDFVFFITIQKEWGWQEGSQSWDHKVLRLYKAPDFHQMWKSLEQADIARWEAWTETAE